MKKLLTVTMGLVFLGLLVQGTAFAQRTMTGDRVLDSLLTRITLQERSDPEGFILHLGRSQRVPDEEIRQAKMRFGLNAGEVVRTLAEGYRPWDIYNDNLELKGVIDLIASGHFSHGDRTAFQPLVDHLVWHDNYLLLADYADYVATQARVDTLYRDPRAWAAKAHLRRSLGILVFLFELPRSEIF